MCTVTRPGLASIAASTAVELLVSMLQHPDGVHAPAPPAQSSTSDTSSSSAAHESILGLIPHQLRGYLAEFRTVPIKGAAYSRCTGCSDTVLAAYESQGWDMLVRAFNEPKFLEALTGLDKLYAEGEAVLESVDWEVEDEEDDM